MRPRIAASVTARNKVDALRDVEEAERRGADLVEIRLDYLKSTRDLRDLANSTLLPTIATNRSTRDGGRFGGSEEKRVDILRYAAASGFKYVDLELRASTRKAAAEVSQIGVRPIISHHFTGGTPSLKQLNQALSRASKIGDAAYKIVTTARKVSDNVTCLRLLAEKKAGLDLVCFAMGKLGTPSRLLSPLLGAYFTFASVRRGREAAPGQLTVDEMRAIYRVMGWPQ